MRDQTNNNYLKLLQSALEEIRGLLIGPIEDQVCSSFLRQVGGVIWRDQLLAHVEENESIWRYGNSEEVEISHSQKLPRQLATISGDVTFSPSFVCEVDNTVLFGPAAIAITDDGVILETTEADKKVLDHRIVDTFKQLGGWRIKQLLTQNCPQKSYELLFPLVRHRSVNYYHWIFEYLRKLRALESYRELTGNNPTVLIAQSSPAWVIESLKLAGYDTEDMSQWHGGVATVDRLVIPQHRDSRHVPPSDCRWVRDRMTSNANGESRSRRVYISRSEASHRRVVNKHELTDVLSAFGFEVYTLEHLPFQEQVSLLANAELVVGPHGAGLVNTIFAENTNIVEFLHGSDIRPHYFRLANLLSHSYEFLVCESHGSDMIVDIETVRYQLEHAVQSRSDL